MSAGHRQTADDILKTRGENWPEAVTPVTHLMVRIFRFSNLILANAARQVTAHGLTFTEFEVLVTLRGMVPPHELPPTELYGAVLISSGGLTKVLRALENKKLITRVKGEADGRSKPVRLTPKGCTLAERIMAEVLRSDRQLISRVLSDAEVERMIRLLRKLLATLESGSTDSRGKSEIEGNPS